MKTTTESKFDRIIKESFQEILKPLGFKKKGNNFYLKIQDLGQIINVQKSTFGTKNDISFTINTGLFIPEYYLAFYNYHDKGVPDFPPEPVCLVRKRIGALMKTIDTWYSLTEITDENILIEEMKLNLHKYILPYFEGLKTKENFLQQLDSENITIAPLGKLIVYAELGSFDKAKTEYYKILSDKATNKMFLETVKEYGVKYGLN